MTWIQTHSGKAFDLVNPVAYNVDFDDIAIALSRINRFTGHTDRETWTVLEHTFLVSHLARMETGKQNIFLHCLMHDLHEAYTGDISAPMKKALEFFGGRQALREIEAGVDRAIYEAAGVNLPDADMRNAVHHFDMMALGIECSRFMRGLQPWGNIPQTTPTKQEMALSSARRSARHAADRGMMRTMIKAAMA